MSSAAHAAAPPPSLNAGPVNTARHQKGSQSEGADTSRAFTSNGQALLFNPEGITVSNGQYALRVGFAHANQVTPQTAESAASREQNVPELSTVTYPDLWDGITLSYDQGNGILRSTYTLAPGADPAAIRLSYNRPFAIQSDGTLTIAFDNGLTLQESAPVAWQDLPGGRVAIEVSFELVAEGMLGFMPGKYDPAYPVTIDPTLSWFTFLGGGGSGDDTGYAITVDGSGNVYVAGVSGGIWGVPLQPFSGNLDAFVAKLNSSGVLQWHTFLGGTGGESGIAIAVDSSGNVYVAGNSNATWGSPVRPFTSNIDGFAAKLNSSGVLQWHTFLGGNGNDYGNGIAVDNSGNVHIAGYSSATWGTPVRAFTGSSEDAYAAKLDSAGNLTWNTFLGGTNNDQGNAIAVDSSGNVYVTGISSASWGTPVRAYTSGGDAFAVRLSSTGTLTWNTFLGGGGTGSDVGNGIAVDSSGNVYVAGLSVASWGTPVRAYSSGTDTFAARLSSAGALTWNTFLGGTGTDQGTGIAVDGSGNIYVSGRSTATWGTPVQAYAGGGWDAFAVRLSSAGALTWNTFLGSTGTDQGNAIAVDGSGNAHVAGYSNTTWGTPIRLFFGGNQDAFAAKLSSAGALTWNTFLGEGASSADNGLAIALDGSGNVYVVGYSSTTWGTPVRAFSGSNDAFVAQLDSNGVLQWNTFLGGTGVEFGYGITVDASNNVYVVGASFATWGTPVRAFSGSYDAFAARLNSSGVLQWHTFLGGAGGDDAQKIAVDSSGNVYVIGSSTATWGTPIRSYTGGGDAFAVRLSSAGTLAWNTFLGGTGSDAGNAITVNGSGDIYVAGYSYATWGTPVRAYSSDSDVFAARLSNTGSLAWNTFLGGTGSDQGYGIAMDGSGNVYVAGLSNITWGTPVRPLSGSQDALVVRLSSTGNLIWHTFLGGTGVDPARAIAVDGSGNVYVTGYSDITWGTPVRAHSGSYDAFAARLDSYGDLVWNTFLGGTAIEYGYGIAVDTGGNVHMIGTGSATWGAGECTGCPKRNYTGSTDALVIKLANTCINSMATGNWNDTATWAAGNVPGSGEWACIQNGHTVTLDTSPGIEGLIVANGGKLVMPLGFTLTAEKLVTNLGTLQQTLNVNNANVPMLEIKNGAGTITRYRGVEINTTNNLGDVTATVQHRASSQYCTNAGAGSPTYARRCYAITPANNLPATVRLYALTTDELNSLVQANLAVFRNPGAGLGWSELPSRTAGNDGGSYSYAQGDSPGFSDFLLGQTGASPTAITVQNVAQGVGQSVVLLGGVVLLLLLTGAVVISRPRKA